MSHLWKILCNIQNKVIKGTNALTFFKIKHCGLKASLKTNINWRVKYLKFNHAQVLYLNVSILRSYFNNIKIWLLVTNRELYFSSIINLSGYIKRYTENYVYISVRNLNLYIGVSFIIILQFIDIDSLQRWQIVLK